MNLTRVCLRDDLAPSFVHLRRDGARKTVCAIPLTRMIPLTQRKGRAGAQAEKLLACPDCVAVAGHTSRALQIRRTATQVREDAYIERLGK